jgi:hypothetical protein
MRQHLPFAHSSRRDQHHCVAKRLAMAFMAVAKKVVQTLRKSFFTHDIGCLRLAF